jgi:hypothetical protein
LTGSEAYLLDDNGKPIPERIHHQDPEVMLAVLKAWRRDRYGQHDQLDVTHKWRRDGRHRAREVVGRVGARERATWARRSMSSSSKFSENDDGADMKIVRDADGCDLHAGIR